MTIANAFNEITAAQGGTPNYSGTIAGAIDALNDALAGSDQPSVQTIEGAVRLLGQHIGGGGGGGLSYDTVIDISNGGGFIDWMTSLDEYNATVTGLTVAEVKQKMEAGEDVRICITSHLTNYGHPVYMEMPVTAAWVYYTEDTFEWIDLHVVAIDTYTGAMSHHCIKWPAGSTTVFTVADDIPNGIEYQA